MAKKKPCSYVISVSYGTGCYRHIRIDADDTLYDLHEAILDAFDFYDDHAHVFFMNNRAWTADDAYYSPIIEDEEQFTDEATLRKLGLLPNKKFLYIFDFGEEHRFSCRVLKIVEEGTDEPEVVRSVGDPPDQYPIWDEDEEE